MAQDSKAAGKQDAKATDNPKTTGKSSVAKKILIWGLSAVMMIGVSAGVALYLTGFWHKPSQGEARLSSHPTAEDTAKPTVDHAPLNSPAQYVSLDPPFIVNFEDQGMLRYLQIGVTVMGRDKAATDAVSSNIPPIRNNLIMLFTSQNLAALGSTEGKEKLRSQALQEIQSVLRREIGRPGIEAVYFTTFVMQ